MAALPPEGGCPLELSFVLRHPALAAEQRTVAALLCCSKSLAAGVLGAAAGQVPLQHSASGTRDDGASLLALAAWLAGANGCLARSLDLNVCVRSFAANTAMANLVAGHGHLLESLRLSDLPGSWWHWQLDEDEAAANQVEAELAAALQQAGQLPGGLARLRSVAISAALLLPCAVLSQLAQLAAPGLLELLELRLEGISEAPDLGEAARSLAGLTALRSLLLSVDTPEVDALLPALGSLGELTSLELYWLRGSPAPGTHEGLRHLPASLRQLKLGLHLALHEDADHEQQVLPLAHLSRLTKLSMGARGIGSHFCLAAGTALPASLVNLGTSDCTDGALLSRLTALETLTMFSATASAEAMRELAPLTWLRSLELCHESLPPMPFGVLDPPLVRAWAGLPVTKLDLVLPATAAGGFELGSWEADVRQLRELRSSLRSLGLYGTTPGQHAPSSVWEPRPAVSGAGLAAALVDLTSLRSLSLESLELSDASEAAGALSRLPSLAELRITLVPLHKQEATQFAALGTQLAGLTRLVMRGYSQHDMRDALERATARDLQDLLERAMPRHVVVEIDPGLP